jgi:hypothetical protein
MKTHKWKFTDKNSQMKIHRWKFTDENSQMKTHKWKLTDENSQMKIRRWKFTDKNSQMKIHRASFSFNSAEKVVFIQLIWKSRPHSTHMKKSSSLNWSQGWVLNMSNNSTRFNSRVGQKILFDGSGRVLAIVRRPNPTREIVRNLRLDKIR